jgi:hypothetical protein
MIARSPVAHEGVEAAGDHRRQASSVARGKGEDPHLRARFAQHACDRGHRLGSAASLDRIDDIGDPQGLQ